LEKHYVENLNRHDAIKLALQGILEVVQTGSKNIDVAVMTPVLTLNLLTADEIEVFIKEIEREKEAEAERKRLAAASRMQ
jgi:20S proteasome alpha/beta subunit